MIKLENVVPASLEQMEFIIQGMRNPMNSWEKSDSGRGCDGKLCRSHCAFNSQWCGNTPKYVIGENDHSLMQRLSNAGTEHRKYLRMMPVYVRITAPLYWWKEFDTYKIGTVANSCSTMHKIAEKKFEYEDFSTDMLMGSGPGYIMKLIVHLNELREEYLNYDTWDNNGFKKPSKKDIWWQLIQLLPSSYNQTRNVMLNYEVLANIYRQRKNHKLDEWREVCKWIETLPYSELIIGGEERKLYSDTQVLAETGQELKRGLRAGIGMVDENDTKCNRCEKLRDCLNSGGLADVTTGNDITKGRYINKPGYDCPKEKGERTMNDDKVSVKEALDKLYDLSWMIGSTAMEYLTDKDGEKIRDYIGVIEDRINDLEKELSEFKKYFEPYDIDEETAEAIIRSKCPNIDSAKDYIQSRLAEDDPMNFSVGKIVHDLIAKELTEDVKKQILEEDSK